jgi:hypothetical protein
MSSRLLLPLSFLALTVLGVVWFLQNYERAAGKEYVPPSGEARLREFLAAERLVERMGLPASELRALVDLDSLPAHGVLLMPRRRQAIDAPHLVRLLGWVQGGGHLVAEAELPGVDDPLLDALGVTRQPAPGQAKLLVAELDERRLKVFFGGRMALKSAARPRLEIDGQLLSFPRGRGLVTVTTSLDFARNPFIGRNDHAELVWTLATLTPAPALRVFFHPERLSLWKFLGENALPALLAGFALLGLWLWRIVPRFGPLEPDLPPARRRLLDHLRASGRYLWSQGLRGRLGIAARDAALRRLGRAQPDFAAASEPEKAARLAALAGISLEAASRFLNAPGATAEIRGGQLMQLAAIAQRVHYALEKGTR